MLSGDILWAFIGRGRARITLFFHVAFVLGAVVEVELDC